MDLLAKLDYENLVAILERPSTVFAGAAEATAGSMLYTKLKACIQKLDAEERLLKEQAYQGKKDPELNKEPPPNE